VHNEGSADIEKAFEHPMTRPMHNSDSRSQIEYYLDCAFSGDCETYKNGKGCHCAVINSNSRKFIITHDGQAVQDFCVVYICGSPGSPNHIGKVKKFPDVLHVSFETLKEKLFGDLLDGMK
jgi:hypothetical protein